MAARKLILRKQMRTIYINVVRGRSYTDYFSTWKFIILLTRKFPDLWYLKVVYFHFSSLATLIGHAGSPFRIGSHHVSSSEWPWKVASRSKVLCI